MMMLPFAKMKLFFLIYFVLNSDTEGSDCRRIA